MDPQTGQPVALLGVGGGVAAYKAVAVASRLRQEGFRTYVAITRAGAEFVAPLTFSAVTGNRTQADMFRGPGDGSAEEIYPHLYPATNADLFCVLPATADLLAKLATGIGDDMVSVSALAVPAACRCYFCPAMNVNMWAKSVVQANAATLVARGWRQIGPAAGHLACGHQGAGRMAEPDEIIGVLLGDAARSAALAGRRVLVLSGPTVEPLDPVRFLSNRSSGKMGRALALAAARAGATVDFVTGPVEASNLPLHPRVTIAPVGTAAEMLAAAQARFAAADAAIFVAAVADFTVAATAARKLERRAGVTLTLVPTPDIAGTLAAQRRAGQVCVGFALETHEGPAHARAKLKRKQLDGIVLNGTDSFGAGEGHFTWFGAATPAGEAWGRLAKGDCAERVIAQLAALLPPAAAATPAPTPAAKAKPGDEG